MNAFQSSGTSSSGKIAFSGHSSSHNPQWMHTPGSMNNISASANPASSFLGWMQSHGHTATHAVSFTPMQGNAITYAMVQLLSCLHHGVSADIFPRHMSRRYHISKL